MKPFDWIFDRFFDNFSIFLNWTLHLIWYIATPRFSNTGRQSLKYSQKKKEIQRSTLCLEKPGKTESTSENKSLKRFIKHSGITRDISRYQFPVVIDNNDLFAFIFSLISFVIAHAERLVCFLWAWHECENFFMNELWDISCGVIMNVFFGNCFSRRWCVKSV